MKVLSEAQPLGSPAAPVHLAIGVFDGVHLGHVQVIQATREAAGLQGGLTVVATFDRHPHRVVDPEHTPPMLYPLWRRLEIINALGVDAVLVFRFDAEFSRQPAEEFVHRLAQGFRRLASVTVGTGFVFGHRRGGDVALLGRLGAELGFAVRGVPPCEADGTVVSSTRIRELVISGALQEASSLLGRPYSIAGEVLEGDRIGRQLGFPTANLDVTGLVLPPGGVYAAEVEVLGQRHAAAVNIGRRPTVQEGVAPVRVEAHLPGYEGDLYGQRLELVLGPRLRGEQRFPSREALRDQIARDVEAVRSWAGNKGLP